MLRLSGGRGEGGSGSGGYAHGVGIHSEQSRVVWVVDDTLGNGLELVSTRGDSKLALDVLKLIWVSADKSLEGVMIERRFDLGEGIVFEGEISLTLYFMQELFWNLWIRGLVW